MKRIKLFGFLLLSFSVIILVVNTLSIYAEDEVAAPAKIEEKVSTEVAPVEQVVTTEQTALVETEEKGGSKEEAKPEEAIIEKSAETVAPVEQAPAAVQAE